MNSNIITRVGDETHVEIKPGSVAKFDSVDYGAIFAGRPLCLTVSGYVVRNRLRGQVGPATIRAHREIMNPPPGMVVDHINHDKLDNRRANLRVCTPSQNRANGLRHRDSASRFKGVWMRPDGKWIAHITHNYRRRNLGTFTTDADAAQAYDDAAKATFGEFALLNLLKPQS